MAEGLKKGQWSKSEDDHLTHGVKRYGYQWTKVATCVASRSADQCAKRWQQSLDPRLDRSEWRDDEDRALLTAVESLGRHWKDIQETYLPHRSKNCVKNRYSVLTRRSAIRLAPYDDTIGSSSSDAGTPMQTDADLPLDFISTSLMQSTQGLYQQHPVPYTSSAELSWPWPGISDPRAILPGPHLGPFDTDIWPAYPHAFPDHAVSSAQSQWDVQPSMGVQQTGYLPHTSHPHVHTHAHSVHHQPLVSGSAQCATPSTHSPGFYAPAGVSVRPPAQRRVYGQGY